MAAASSSSPCPSSSSHSDAGPLGTAARRHLPFAKMLQTPRFSNPFAALPIPGGSSSESSAASADSAASPASASASPPSASASSAFQGDAASPSAASPSAAAPYSAPSAAGSKALILLPRQRLLLVPAADSTLATPADVITVVDAGSRKDPSVELIPGPAGDAGPSAVIPGPRVVTWSKLAGWRVELPPNLPDLTKLRPDIEKLRPALEARVQHTLSHVPFRELLEEIQQWSKARGGIGGWAEGSARGARRYPNKQKLSSVQDFFQYAEAEGRRLFAELDKDGDGQVKLEDLERALKRRRLPAAHARPLLRRLRRHWLASSFGCVGCDWSNGSTGREEFQSFMEAKEPTMLRAFTSLCVGSPGMLQKGQSFTEAKEPAMLRAFTSLCVGSSGTLQKGQVSGALGGMARGVADLWEEGCVKTLESRLVRVGGVPDVHGGQGAGDVPGFYLAVCGVGRDAAEGTGTLQRAQEHAAREQRASYDAVSERMSCGVLCSSSLTPLPSLLFPHSSSLTPLLSLLSLPLPSPPSLRPLLSCHQLFASLEKAGLLATESNVRATMRFLNADESGHVFASLEKAGLPATESNVRAMMRFLDADDSGHVTYGDFRNFLLLLPPERLQGSDPSMVWYDAATMVPMAPPAATSAPAGSVIKSALAGGLASGLSTCLMHPLDTIKTRVQASSASLSEVVQSVPSIGIQGLYRGAPPAILGQFASHGVRTGAYEASKMLLTSMLPNLTEYQVQPVASLCSTVLGTALRIPCEVLKQQLQAGLYSSTGAALRATLKEGGVKGLFRGTTATLCREVPFYVFGMLIYLQVKRVTRHVLRRELAPWETLLLGGFSGGMAAIAITPFDVIKTRMMTSPPGAAAAGMLTVGANLLATEGVGALYKGWLPRFFWIAPLGAMNFAGLAGYELVKEAIDVGEEGKEA
ncbi:unnamed protein product [Closterium sp. NIES-65]|nr:unnamed protein product [Closterium sp. NIES-65]